MLDAQRGGLGAEPGVVARRGVEFGQEGSQRVLLARRPDLHRQVLPTHLTRGGRAVAPLVGER